MSVFKKRKKWYFRFKIRGKEYYKSIPEATDQQSALQYETIVKAELMKGNLGILETKKRATLKDGVALYLEYSKNNKRSTANDKAYTDTFLKFFKGLDLDEITPSKIEDFKKYLLKNGKSKATVNKYLQALSKLFNVAIDNEIITTNPKQKVKNLKTENNKIRFLEKSEEKSLMSVLPKFYYDGKSSMLKLIVKVALKTGMRRNEILTLKWQNVDFKNNVFELLVTKSGKSRKIPIAKTLKKFLEKLKKVSNSEYLFVNPETQKRYVDIKKSFKTALKQANIENFRFHDLRHTFATRLIEKGVDIVVVKELMGHANISTTMIYVHTDATRKKNAIGIIDRY